MEVKTGYKKTEVGVIPEDWQVAVLDSLGRPGRPAVKAGPFGSSLTKATYVAKGYKVYGQEQVIRGDYSYGDYYISKARFNDLKGCSVEAGDVLLSLVGTAGRVLVIPPHAPEGIINPRLIRFSFDRKVISPRYFQSLFESYAYQSLLARIAQGGTMGVLNAKLLRPIPIPLPRLIEQEAIAEALSDADALIESIEQLLTKKRNLKQGAMQELLTGKKRLPGFSWKWEVKSLGEIGESLIGLTYAPSDVRADGVLVLRSSNIFEGSLHFDDNVYVSMEISNRIMVRTDDILICVRNGSRGLIGKCARIDDRCKGMTFGAFMAVFRTPFSGFVFHQFQSDVLKRQIHEHLGATINQITNKSLNSFRIPFPDDKAEQEAIAAILSDMDAEIAALETKLAKARQLKQGMMQELLTGRIRLV